MFGVCMAHNVRPYSQVTNPTSLNHLFESRKINKFKEVSSDLPRVLKLNNYNQAFQHIHPRQGTRTMNFADAWAGNTLYRTHDCIVKMFTMAPNLEKHLTALMNESRHVLFRNLPRVGQRVVMKLEEYRPSKKTQSASKETQKKMYARWLDQALRESSAHKQLSGRACMDVPRCSSICVKNYIPQFFFSGVVVDVRGRTYTYNVMSNAGDRNLRKWLDEHGGRLSAQEYVQVERAACSLWLNGVVHGDLHRNNIMYDPATKRATIIDFGMCVILPQPMSRDVKARVAQGIEEGVRSLAEIFRSPNRSRYGLNLQRYVAREHSFSRGILWHNPDYTLITQLYNRVRDPENVPEQRAFVWGFKGKANFLEQPGGNAPGNARGNARVNARINTHGNRTGVNTKNNRKSNRKSNRKNNRTNNRKNNRGKRPMLNVNNRNRMVRTNVRVNTNRNMNANAAGPSRRSRRSPLLSSPRRPRSKKTKTAVINLVTPNFDFTHNSDG